MQEWAKLLRTKGDVVLMDYSYTKEGRCAPDRLPKLIAAHRAAWDRVKARHPRRRIILVGKSMGSRVGCLRGSPSLYLQPLPPSEEPLPFLFRQAMMLLQVHVDLGEQIIGAGPLPEFAILEIVDQHRH
jgi:hypothetical protein